MQDPFSRFPRNRIRSNSRLSSSPTSSLGTPDFANPLGFSGSSTSSEPPRIPSFLVGDTPMPKSPGDKSLLSPASHESHLAKFLSKSGPVGGESARNTPSNLQLKRANKNPLISPQNSSRFGPPSSRELPSLLQKYAGSRPRDLQPRLPILTTSKVKGQRAVSPYRQTSQGEVGSPSYKSRGMRDRSYTAPANRMMKKPLLRVVEKTSGHGGCCRWDVHGQL